MARRLTAAWLLLAVACVDPAPMELSKLGSIEGALELSEGSRGDAYVFLYPRAPEAEAPVQLTAVSDLRLASGDRRYVLGAVAPNPYRLRAFLDVDRNFQPVIDVLAQPGAGDRVAGEVELNLQPGQALEQDLAIREPVPSEPPAFRLDREPRALVTLPDRPVAPISFELVPESVGGFFRAAEQAFRVRLADDDGDGRVDDENGDGIPELYPRVFLRFLPKPGQVVPVDPRGRPATVMVPLLFNPGPFLTELRGDAERAVAVDRLQVFLVPQAQAITEEAGRGRVVTPMDAIPVGQYELVVLDEAGQYWRLPNDLAGEAGRAVGGPFEHQGVRFEVLHGTGLDPSP